MAEKFEKIANAISNALQGKESETEKEELKEWVNSSEANRDLIEEISDDNEFERELKYFNNCNAEECKQILWQRINALENEKVNEPRSNVKIVTMPRRIAVAVSAAAMLLLVVGVVYYWYRSSNKQSVTVTEESKSEIATAAGDDSSKITLRLADGSRFIVDQEQSNKTVSKEYGVFLEDHKLIVKQTAGYKKKGKSPNHTLIIPRGGQFQLTLSDGSKVWLNSESSIEFPAVDTGKTRNATIKGEVYIEIKHDSSRPFVVRLPRATTLEVLGTAFNVNAYSNEPFIGTTLIDGSVKINRAGQVMAIKPGQQARIFEDKIQIKDSVDISGIIAWKDGEFDFRRDSLTSVVRQLARWYNMKVHYIETPQILVIYSGKKSLSCDATLARLKKGNSNIHIERSNDTLIVRQ